jgi:hypothetical protein
LLPAAKLPATAAVIDPFKNARLFMLFLRLIKPRKAKEFIPDKRLDDGDCISKGSETGSQSIWVIGWWELA